MHSTCTTPRARLKRFDKGWVDSSLPHVLHDHDLFFNYKVASCEFSNYKIANYKVASRARCFGQFDVLLCDLSSNYKVAHSQIIKWRVFGLLWNCVPQTLHSHHRYLYVVDNNNGAATGSSEELWLVNRHVVHNADDSILAVE